MAQSNALERFVRDTVSGNVSLIASDETQGYQMLKPQGFPYETVRHSESQYVKGNVDTANLDSFWSLLKRRIMASYHKMTKEYLPLYVTSFLGGSITAGTRTPLPIW